MFGEAGVAGNVREVQQRQTGDGIVGNDVGAFLRGAHGVVEANLGVPNGIPQILHLVFHRAIQGLIGWADEEQVQVGVGG